MKYAIIIILIFFSNNDLGAMKMLDIESIFEKHLTEKGITFEKIEKNIYKIKTNSEIKTISLNNIEKNYLRDGDIKAIYNFVENILQITFELPEWAQLKKGLFVSIEPSDLDGIREMIYEELSNATVIVLAYYDNGANQIHWITSEYLKKIKTNVKVAWEQAYQNLENIMLKTDISFTEIEDQKLGMIEAYEPYKASLILTKGLKVKVSESIGWPIYAVFPARDFVYLFSTNGGLVNKAGQVVIDEYNKSGYPISIEVWKLSDKEPEAIGAFPNQ